MRVLFTTVAQSTHLYNMVPLAWAMHCAGHEVRVVSSHDFAGRLAETGLMAVPMGAPVPPARRLTAQDFVYPEPRPAEPTWEYILGKFTVFSGLMFPYYEAEPFRDEVIDFAHRWRPDLVVWDMFSFVGAAAAAVSGAANVRMLVGADYMGQFRELFLRLMNQQPPEQRDDPLAEWISWPLRRYGIPFREELVVGRHTIDPLPAALRLPVDLDYLPVRFVPYHGPAECPAWVHEPPKHPRVCLTLGLTSREGWDVGETSVDDLFKAVAGLEIEVIATFSAEQLGDAGQVPANVRVVDFVPLHGLLPSCSALIHHGGTGSFCTALIHGIPQLVVPHGYWDTTNKARLVEECGAGLHLPADRCTPTELRARLVELLRDPSFRTGAAKMRAEELAKPTPSQLVERLERIAAEHRARGGAR